jgi:hypothetical protein
MNTQEQERRKFELFEEVVNSNLEMFVNAVKRQSFDYRALNTTKIINLDEDEVRSLAVNFFMKSLSKDLNEKIGFYFDKKIKTEI